MSLVDKALTFATQKHQGQLYGNGKLYIMHPSIVASLCATILENDENLVAAGFLHDTMEDCGVTKGELEKEFNADIADLVWQVSKDEEKNFSHIHTYRGLILKSADLLANTSQYKDLDPERRKKLFNKYASQFIFQRSNLKLHEVVIEK